MTDYTKIWCVYITYKMDLTIQQYRAYLNDEASSDKCLVTKLCDKGVYNMSPYLLKVRSPQIGISLHNID